MSLWRPAALLAAAGIGAASFPTSVKSQTFEGPRFSHDSKECQFIAPDAGLGVVVSLGKPLYVASPHGDFESTASGTFKQVPVDKGAKLPSNVVASIRGAESDLLQRCVNARPTPPEQQREVIAIIGNRGIFRVKVPSNE